MNRAQRRKAARDSKRSVQLMVSGPKIEKLSGDIAAARHEEQQLAKEIRQIEQQLKSGTFSSMASASQDKFRREYAAREAKKAQLQRNGITIQDLEENYRIGYEDGLKEGQQWETKAFFAAICLALNKHFGFGAKRCHRILTEVYDTVCFNIDSQEIVQEVFDTMGLFISFDTDPFDPVDEVPKKKGGKKK